MLKTGLLYIMLLTFMLSLDCVGQVQQSYLFSNGGQSFTNGKLSLTYSVGEPLVNYNKLNNLIETQGFHQQMLTGTNSIVETDHFFRLMFPNPASSNVFINSDSDELKSINVFNAKGQLVLLETNTYSSLINLSLENLSSGIYYVRVQTASTYYSNKLTVVK